MSEPAAVSDPTGDPVVDRALASLEDLARRPVAEHVAAFEQAHGQLVEALTREDPSPGGMDL